MKVYQKTHVGKVRKNNEDALLVTEPNIFVAADGMGGAAAGEVASKLLVDTVKNFLSEIPEPLDEKVLSKSILKASAAIMRETYKNPDLRGMGTTATILHIYNGQAYFAHVGDSRLYLLKNSFLEQITLDHSYVETLVRNGELTPEQARVHPMKNILTQAVGATSDLEVETGNFKIEGNEKFLLCTDGLTNMVEDAVIKKILAESQSPAEDLIQAALDNGGHDNITAVVVCVDD
ncbi:MAG: Stp1/IreP family PP2C-type Ser/Thr phosphatase [Selenomonadaceae bacterium]|nr:Stp1/IreP family PP2C-type Ser/Thr phosphatase [Selenomonadaceae bacterium]